MQWGNRKHLVKAAGEKALCLWPHPLSYPYTYVTTLLSSLLTYKHSKKENFFANQQLNNHPSDGKGTFKRESVQVE